MKQLNIGNLGPITSADVTFGDLTLLVGAQATGKSVFLQLLKLLVDKKHIRRTLEQYGFVWNNDISDVLDRYFGEGMAGIWSSKTKITIDNKDFSQKDLLPKQGEQYAKAAETLFYVPAQRVVCLQNGWPRFFTDYEDSVPYVLRHFSETLRQLLETHLGKRTDAIFPQSQSLKAPLRDSFNDSIFHDGKIIVDKTGKKRFKLTIGGSQIPFMAWSAGQKEFMPLLLSFYWLCPPSKASTKDHIKYVIIEEPEMGLHPEAIQSVLLQVIDLVVRGYKVIISTHSPVLLEFAWAVNHLLRSSGGSDELHRLFGQKKSLQTKRMFDAFLKEKTIKTYAFGKGANNGTLVKDISTLDPGNDDVAIADWGGLSSFSSKAADVISKLVARNG